MRLIAKTDVKIENSSGKIFSVISNMERFGDWFPHVKSIRSIDDKPHGKIGKKYLEVVSVPIRGDKEIEIVVVDSLVNERFVTEGNFSPLFPRMEIQISEDGPNSTLVRWSMYSRSSSLLVKAFLLPLAVKTMQSRADIAAVNLKNLLEKGI